jgi:polyisoprenoid-binding protein YceI
MRIVLIPLLALIPWGAATADTFQLDKQHTEVRVSWDHMGLSRPSAKFTDVSGTVGFDPEKPEESTVAVEIKVSSLVTGVAALDAVLLKTKDYFDTNAHPTMTFKSTGVRSTGDKTAELMGDLTINGVSKPVTLAVVWNFLGPHPLGQFNPTYQGITAAGFTARTQILRSAWGIERTIPLVSDEIRIVIETEMHKVP